MSVPPLFSIAIPTYNRLELFKQTLASAQAQTYTNIEILVFDNHTTDGTYEYTKEVMQEDYRIKCIRNTKNIGGIKNYEHIVKTVKGKYLVVLSDDDILSSKFCETAVVDFLKYPSIVLWISRVDLFFGYENYKSENKANILLKQSHRGLMSGDVCIKKAFKSEVSLMFCGTVYLTAALAKAGGFCCGSYSLDLAATLSTATRGDVYLCCKTLSHARAHEDNTSLNLNLGKPLLEIKRALKLYSQLKMQNNAAEKYKNEYLFYSLNAALAKITTFKHLSYLRKICSAFRQQGFSFSSIWMNLVRLIPKMLTRIVLGTGLKLRIRQYLRR